ncbi:hypothetical protein AYL99_05437 [Fonsecaea erecta]|uniref:Uncharacterized protein n=1 Tax=Fonsecaea erecta TaxID=1367422 RepID=A0A178ZN40_9EURO|nr:hypothetical protein AYL99_05437 [Fonsecaea erecta]OAP60435.1 hypothetical protein AYL99_05437 [Fonsecaea erecta]
MEVPGQQPPAELSEPALETPHGLLNGGPSQPASPQEDSLLADILHHCDLTLRLVTQVSDWKEKDAQTKRELRRLKQLDSYMDEARWAGDDDMPVLMLRVVWVSQKHTVLKLMVEELKMSLGIWSQLNECMVFFNRDNKWALAVAPDSDERLKAKIPNAATVLHNCMNQLHSVKHTWKMYHNVFEKCDRHTTHDTGSG